MGKRAYTVNIVGLSSKVHNFEFELDDAFFSQYGTNLIESGSFKVDVELDKHETFIGATFKAKGQAKLVCDRSLDQFDYPVKFEKKILFKYGDANEELSDEIIMIHRDTDSLELGQYIYEFIGLQIPMKKLHPRYQNEADEATDGKIIYSSGDQNFDADSSDDIDPRWEKLKKLK